MKIDILRKQLSDLNNEIADLMALAPVSLSYQKGDAEKDTLFLYGIVGGKDVGKTALINQLAGTTISIDTDMLDEGTQEAVAYCYQQDLSLLKKRFSAEVIDRIRFVGHERSELQNAVLIDLPDFDSRFISHCKDTRRLSKHLDGMIWITTPRKYGDHELLVQLESIAQSHENYFVVLNKIDQLENIAALDTVRQEIISYLNAQCHKRNIPAPDPSHFFIISAHEPGQYEFEKLRDRLIRPHLPDEISTAKNKNLQAEFSKNLQRIYSYYDVQKRVEQIDQALEKIQKEVASQFSVDYFETVWRRVASLETLGRRISGTLFRRQIEDWPILRLLFYPLAGIVSGFGGRFAFSKAGQEWSDSPRDLLRYEGQSASFKMQKIRITIEDLFSDLKPDFGDAPNYSKLLEERFDQFLNTYEDQVTDHLVKDVTRPGFLKRVFVYLPLIWFPFLQPVCLHLGAIKDSLFSTSGLKDFYPVLISLFGARSLLVSLVFLILFYTIWLILIYAYGARKAQKKGAEEFRNLWYSQFLTWVMESLAQPLPNIRVVLTNKIVQLEQIQSTIGTLTGCFPVGDTLPDQSSPVL